MRTQSGVDMWRTFLGAFFLGFNLLAVPACLAQLASREAGERPSLPVATGIASGGLAWDALEPTIATAASDLEARALAGDPVAMWWTARVALQGLDGHPVDRQAGMQWLEQAAERGVPDAQHALAVEVLRGAWSEVSLARALPWLDASLDVRAASRSFVRLLFREAPWSGLPLGAVRADFLALAVRAGVPEAAYELALWREAEAAKWTEIEPLYLRAGEGGDLRAVRRLGDSGSSGEMPPFENALAIARGYREGTLEAQLELLAKAAAAGHPVAEFQLALIESGRPGATATQERAIFGRLLRAAEGECVEAMRQLARVFDEGTMGMGKDPGRAMLWYLEAARRGDASSASRLGEIYIAGDGLSFRDPMAARAWWQWAAEQGNAKAQYNLAVLCDRGPEFLHDATTARQLYQAAGMQGVSAARVRLAELLAQEESEAMRENALALYFSVHESERGDGFERLCEALPEEARERARARARYFSFDL